MSETTALAVQQSTSLGLEDKTRFDHIQRVAKMFSESQLVPVVFQNNLPNVVIALEMAQRMGAGAMQVMQNLNIIHGKPSFGASFMIAAVNASGRFSPLRFKMVGEPNTPQWGCYAVSKAAVDNEECRGVTVTMLMAEKEGWLTKNGSKWKTMPELMLQYRAATWWTRAFAPEILMGFPTAEETYDIHAIPADIATEQPAVAEVVKDAATKKPKGLAAMKRAEPVVDPQPPVQADAKVEVAPTPAPVVEKKPAAAPTVPAAPVATAATTTDPHLIAPAGAVTIVEMADRLAGRTPTETKVAAPKAPVTTTPAPVATSEPPTAAASAPKEEETPFSAPAPQKKHRCEVMSVTEIPARVDGGTLAKVCKIRLNGELDGMAYFNGPKERAPAQSTIIDAVLTLDKPHGNGKVNILESFEVLA